jgi:hypothetical protein
MSWRASLALLLLPLLGAAPVEHKPLAPADPTVAALVSAARASAQANHARLAQLCDEAPARLAGTPNLAAAVRITADWLRADGQEGVATEPVMVPVWVRGAEQLRWLSPGSRQMAMLGLGGSVGTPGIEAPAIVIHDWSELGPQVKGKIVVYNHPMKEGLPSIDHYGPAVAYRGQGASRAAAHGAVAVLVRSVTTRSLYTPHTGGMRYDPAQPQIPAASIPTEEADWIDRLTARGVEVRLRLEMGATALPDALSHNVVAELRGARKPGEIILIGAHLDSWDVGQGAHDDGAGVVEVVEALRLLRAAPQRPARTVRVVLFTNEENGLRGGLGYAEAHKKERHIAAIESDLGGGWPMGFGATGTPQQIAWLRKAAAPLGLPISEGGGGADIGPLGDQGALLIGLEPDDSHYFDVHHTHADTVDKVNPTDLAEATGAVAGLAFLLANAE